MRSFANELLRALADTGLFEQVALRTEGPIADGQAYVGEELFLRFYFNEATGTMAFALVEKQQVLMQGGAFAQACFYSQQSGEKAVKALWHLIGAD